MAENWLKDYGFNALQLPRRDLSPADVLHKANGGFQNKVGNLGIVFTAEQDLPASKEGEPVADISRSSEKKVEISLGAKILGAILPGGAKLGANLQAKHAKALTITYESVKQDSIEVLELQDWITTAKPKLQGQGLVWLNDDELAAVSAVLKTKTLSVIAEAESGEEIALSLPEVQGIFSASGNVTVISKTSSKLTFEGPEPIAFGFQAYVMNFEGNQAFGIEALRTALSAPDIPGLAWKAASEIELRDAALPAE